jgi:cysteine desulfurase
MATCGGLANPASSHAPGRRARRVLEDARENIGRLLGANLDRRDADQIIFTSGGTESNNLAILGLAARSKYNSGHAVISAIEHPSVVGPAEHLRRLGWKIDRAPVDENGVVRLDAFADLVTTDTRFVSLMLGNNETGVLQPVAAAADICRARNVPLHCDAVQVVGKLPVDFRSLGVDLLTAAAHKFHGPRGIGVLIKRAGISLEPLLYGGFQQSGIRPGTESVALAVGMSAALSLWHSDQDRRRAHLAELRDSLESQLKQGWPELVVNGAGATRLPHTSNVSFPGLDRQALLMALDAAGVACSTGSACASGSNEPSPVLLAMGCSPAVVAGSLRLSVGVTNTPAEVAQAAALILKAATELRGQKTAEKTPTMARRPAAKTL